MSPPTSPGSSAGQPIAGEPIDGRPIAVAMVGGRGTRLRPITDTIPKPLLEVGNERIIERIIGRLAQGGIVDVWLTVHYRAAMFRELLDENELGVRLHYIDETTPLGTAGGLREIPPDRRTGPIVVTNGDLVTELDFAELLASHRASGSLVTVVGVEHHWACAYGVLRTNGAQLQRIDEKPGFTDLVNAGMYVVAPELLDHLPTGGRLGMPDVIGRALDDHRGVNVYRFDGVWNDVGSHDELERVRLMYAETDGPHAG